MLATDRSDVDRSAGTGRPLTLAHCGQQLSGPSRICEHGNIMKADVHA